MFNFKRLKRKKQEVEIGKPVELEKPVEHQGFSRPIPKVVKAGAVLGLGILLGSSMLYVGQVAMGQSSSADTTATAENSSGNSDGTSAIQRAKDQIAIAAGKTDGTFSDGNVTLTDSEFKTIGFYASNYLTPFVTDVSKQSRQKKDDTLASQLTKAFSATSKLNGDLKEISKTVASYMTNTEDIYLTISHDNGKTWVSSGHKASYFDMLYGSLQIFNQESLSGDLNFDLADRYGWESTSDLVGFSRGAVAKSKGSEIKRSQILYEMNPVKDQPATISQQIFAANLSAQNNETSYGSSDVYFTADDLVDAVKNDNNPAKKVYEVINKSGKTDNDDETIQRIYEASIYSNQIVVDAFGTIYAKAGNTKTKKQITIMPAAQNPMYFAKKNDSIKYSGSSSSETKSSSDEETSTSSSEKPEKSKKKSKKKKSDSGNSEDGTSKTSSTDSVSKYIEDLSNADGTGVGYNVPVANINTATLIQNNIISVSADTLTSNVSSLTVYPFAFTDKTTWDENSLSSDHGARLNDALVTQMIIRRIPLSTSTGAFPSEDDAKKYIEKSLNDTYSHLKSKSYLMIGSKFGVRWHINATLDRNNGTKYSNLFVQLGSGGGYSDTALTSVPSATTGTSGVIDSLIVFDNMGLNTASDYDTEGWGNTVKVAHISGVNGDDSSGDAGVSATAGRIVNGKYQEVTSVDKAEINGDVSTFAANLYVSYMLTRGLPTDDKVDYVINLDGTPEASFAEAAANADQDGGDTDAILKNMAYYMLNPTLGREYKQRWYKTFINNALLVSLEDMIGANTSSSYGGTTRYLELTGFATIPRLNEVKITAYMYDNFTTWGVFILVIAAILMVLFVFIGQVKVIPAILGVIAFGFFLYTPPKIINSLINVTNSVSGTFFKDKFYFWALYQHQNYEDSLETLMDAGKSGDTEKYNSLLLTLQGGTGIDSGTGTSDVYEWQQTLGAVVKVRWMAPKKDGIVEQLARDIDSAISSGSTDDSKSTSNDSTSSSSSSSDSNGRTDNQSFAESSGGSSDGLSTLTKSLLGVSQSNKESYTDLDTNYLYRGYTDISDYSRFYYGNIMGDNISNSSGYEKLIGDYNASLNAMFPSDGVSASSDITLDDQRKSITKYISTTDNSDEANKDNSQLNLFAKSKLGFINDRQGGTDGGLQTKYLKRIFAPISSTTVSKTSQTDVSKSNIGDTLGLDKNYFILSIRDYNNHEKSMGDIMSELNADYGGTTMDSDDATSLGVFALNTESPYYYFAWDLFDQGLSTDKGSSGNFKDMMLENNDSFFYNYNIQEGQAGYGAMKDYLDMSSMFTVLIPYLRQSNNPLLQWADYYGTTPYDGYGVSREDLQAITDKSSEAYYKTWFNYSEDSLYHTYSAWVDALYDLDIAKPEKISYGDQEETVKEPLNPASYTIRPMIFSESEMEYYGLKDYQLTKVEQAIIKTQKDIRNDWLNLMNYYELDDVVLNNAMAMIAVFDFNKNFSQDGITQDNIILEPQGFELKTFGWDGYLRLILQNASGESLQYNKELNSDIYEVVAEKAGTMTLLMMWLQSAIVVYILPTALVLLLITLPIAMIVAVFAAYIKRDTKAYRSFARDCFVPFLSVLGTNVALAWIVSRLMGDGNTTLVTGDLTGSTNFSSPNTTMGVLLFVTSIAVVIYFKSVMAVFKGITRNGRTIAVPVKMVAEKAGSMSINSVTSKLSDIANSMSGIASSRGTRSGGGRRGRGAGGYQSPQDETLKNNGSASKKGLLRRRGRGVESQQVDDNGAKARYEGIMSRARKVKAPSFGRKHKTDAESPKSDAQKSMRDILEERKSAETEKRTKDILGKHKEDK